MPTSRTRMTIVTHHGSSPRIDSADERAADEHLVGDRVEQLAEVGDEVAAAREVAVDAVGGDRDDEQRGRHQRSAPSAPSSASSIQRKTGAQQDAHDRDDVGGSCSRGIAMAPTAVMALGGRQSAAAGQRHALLPVGQTPGVLVSRSVSTSLG